MVRLLAKRSSGRWHVVALATAAFMLAMVLAACNGSTASTPTPTPTPTPIPLATFAGTPVSSVTTGTATTSTGAPTGVPSVVPSESTDPEPSEDSVPIPAEALGAEIEALVDGIEGFFEIVVALPDGTILSQINSDEPIEAASLYKLAIMVELFVERETGDLTFDEEIVLDDIYFVEDDGVYSAEDIGMSVSIDALMQSMITLSSNVAATALLDRVGNENVNQTMASLGLFSTEIRWSPGRFPEDPIPDTLETPTDDEPSDDEPVEEEETEEGGVPIDRALMRAPAQRRMLDLRADEAFNVTTAADIAALYIQMINGQIISDDASQEMLLLLENQQINDRLPAYLPEDTIVAHKTGNLDGLVHDAGVIFAPAGPIVVVVLTEDVPEWQAIDLIATIARLAYDTSL